MERSCRFRRRTLLFTCGLLNTLFLILYVVFDRLIAVSEGFKYGLVVVIVFYECSYGQVSLPLSDLPE